MNRITSESSKKMAENDSTISVEKRVSNLTNSTHFFLQKAIVIELDKGTSYRLVVIKAGKILTNTVYTSPRAAKIAFGRLYSQRHFQGDKRNKKKCFLWSDFYIPEKKHLDSWLRPKKRRFNQ